MKRYVSTVPAPTIADWHAACVAARHDNRTWGYDQAQQMCWRCWKQLQAAWSKWSGTVWAFGPIRQLVTLVDPPGQGWQQIDRARVSACRVGSGHVLINTPWTGSSGYSLMTTVQDGWRVLDGNVRIHEPLVQKLLQKLGETR